jgi:hypothetical protein
MTATHRDIRDYLLGELHTELVGPHQPDEILSEDPVNHYLTGVLYPRNSAIDPAEDRDAGEAPSEDEVGDEGIVLAAAFNPSALGLTCVVPLGSRLTIRAAAAVYLEVTGDTRSTWQRQPLDLEPVTITADSERTARPQLATGLELFVRLRPRGDRCVVTVTLVNTNHKPAGDRDARWSFFQPLLELTAAEGDEGIFLPRAEEAFRHERPERLLNELLYRHAPEFAVGHGCAVAWDVAGNGNARAVRTAIIPAYELLQFSPDPRDPFPAQEMRFLAEAGRDDLLRELRVLPDRYRAWIAALDLAAVPAHLAGTAQANVQACLQTAERIEQGIALLEQDDQARLAFQLANRAMLLQRARITWIRSPHDDRPDEPVLDDSHRWRPFQLAFILLTLPSIADLENRWREVVDLLWFPTGGGKTEAYLGLTAFTIFLRRLRLDGNPRAAGVTVLMRYTLRLLTIQQFQRAATLIMACEYLRRTRADIPGDDEISLGLWVGGGATPNTLKQAATALKELLKGERVFEGSPYQIHACPWCGTELTPNHYHVQSSLTIGCPNAACDFAGRLPLYLVDEDVYNWRPTLLIGTVDKFARLPWLGETSALFGGINTDRLPPELIIQDELHLISGPLGTLVGLYETAVDVLCSKGGRLPKVIASTATIRRAAEQSLHLFGRGLAQFPPPALDARDNFFSRQVPPEERPGRVYAGIHAPGRSMKTALLRIYAVLLQRLYEHTAPANLRDPYWTLVGYFNSMRELGGAVRLVEDDVRAHINLLARSDGVNQRFIRDYRELNSRIGSDRIPEILARMEQPLTADATALDVLLATNMISVGVDVDRLGLMVVTGQPKTTSEYIQATSRVGRRYPGLIVTLYNWMRPRDRSHYERFHSYHSALYSQVEPTSVTPFSSRARDRGLHGVYITLIRHLSATMNPADAAHLYDPDGELAARVRDLILQRVAVVEPDELEDTRRMLDDISHRWELLARRQPLPYGKFGRQPGEVHLMAAAEDEDPGMMFPTLNSLREVEGESGIFFPKKRPSPPGAD